MTLTKQMRLSDTGMLIRRSLEDRLNVFRLQADSSTNHEDNLIRIGHIREVKALIALFDEPIVTQ